MSKYRDFNTVTRKKYNDLSLLYNGVEIEKYYMVDFEEDTGAHSIIVSHINEPDSTEVGYNAGEQLTGFLQIGVFLPTVDKGLSYSLDDLASQIDTQFPRSGFIDGDLKVEWLNVQRGDPARIGGHMVITMRVNFRVFAC
jgi:hypothetical protein